MKPLIFMHIPKTSGIAVAHALVEAERPERVFFGFDRAFFGGFKDFASVAPETRAFIHLSPEALPPNERVVRAHMALSTLRAAYPNGRFMTVLREPVCRVLSHFVFWRGFTQEQLADWGGWAAISMQATGEFGAFLASPDVACQIDNVALRLLLWPHKLIPDDAMINPADDAVLLEEAWARLADLDFAEAIESGSFASRLGTFLGTPVQLDAHNVSPAPPAALRDGAEQALTTQAHALLGERTRLDLVLWQRLLARAGENAEALRQQSLQQGYARFDRLMRKDGP